MREVNREFFFNFPHGSLFIHVIAYFEIKENVDSFALVFFIA